MDLDLDLDARSDACSEFDLDLDFLECELCLDPEGDLESASDGEREPEGDDPGDLTDLADFLDRLLPADATDILSL